MTSATVKRVFEVDAAARGGVAAAGRGGAMAGVGAPHHLGDGVAAG